MTDDELVALLEPLDPSRVDAVPAAGSERYRSILATARTKMAAVTVDAGGDAAAPRSTQPGQSKRRRRRLGLSIAAVAVAVLGGFAFVQSGHDHTAQAAITAAAEGMAEVDSYEGWTTQIDPPQREIVRVRVSGDDVETIGENPLPDGSVQIDEIDFIDGILYESIGGGATTVTPRPDIHIPDYAQASGAVVLAIVDDATITDYGPEEISGVMTERYTLRLDKASRADLAALPREYRSIFGLDPSLDSTYPVIEISLWIADDLIHRVDVVREFIDPGPPETPGFTQRTEYFNFNGKITITPPPGPYSPAPQD